MSLEGAFWQRHLGPSPAEQQQMLAEASLGQPERQRLADEIAELAAGCGRG